MRFLVAIAQNRARTSGDLEWQDEGKQSGVAPSPKLSPDALPSHRFRIKYNCEQASAWARRTLSLSWRTSPWRWRRLSYVVHIRNANKCFLQTEYRCEIYYYTKVRPA